MARVETHEVGALLWAFSYFFALLCGYYIVRPMRDEMGVAGGVDHLQWLFTATFVVMLAAVPLFGWVTSRFARKQFIPLVYYFFVANLLLFFALFRSDLTYAWVARAFFVWASVFNLFVVSVFWSFMADIFSNQQARRLFGLIAAGGTCGALAGPVITTALAVPLGATNLLPISALCLLWAVVCVRHLGAWSARQARAVPGAPPDQSASPMGGRLLDGIRLVLRSPYLLGICVLMLLFTTLSTFLYFQQAQIIADRFSDSDQRTSVFAAIDLAVNGLTILLQILVTGRLVKAVGLAVTLALVPLMLAVGFLALGLAPVLAVLVVVQVTRRAGNYAIMRPAREMLFVVVDRDEKYKAKNFIDTVVYRGGDAVSAWCYAGLQALGLGLAQIAWLAVPLALLWGWLSHALGRRQTQMAQARGRAE